MENQFSLETIKVNQLPEIKGYETRQKALVKNHPFVEIVDSKTEADAKKNRTALKGGRTELQKGEKAIASKLSNFRKQVKEEVEKLVKITVDAEQKQQEEIDRYDKIKADKKEAEEQKEKERVRKITDIIDGTQIGLTTIIDVLTYETINEQRELFETLIKKIREGNDFEEQTQFFEMMVSAKGAEFQKRAEELEKAEQLRLDNVRLKKEADAREKKISEEREAQRIKDEEADKERKAMADKIAKLENAAKIKREAEEKEKARLKKIVDTEKAALKQIADDKAAKEKAAKEKRENEKRQKELAPQKTKATKLLLSKISQNEFDEFKSDEINEIVVNCITQINIVIKSCVEEIKNL